jgi:hypothetical protein
MDSSVHVLVPYRDREKHLKQFMDDFVPVLKKNIPDINITIIEQSQDNKGFNRGKLLNVGIKEECDSATHFIFHDVDTLSDDFCVKQLYRVHSHHEDIVRICVPHSTSLGCICKFTKESIFKINGFPNSIYGWGIEDRALYWRSKIKKVSMSVDNTHNYSFKNLPHPSNVRRYFGDTKSISERWKENNIKKLKDKDKNKLVDSDGLNNVDYKVLNYTHIGNGVHKMLVELDPDPS